MSLAFETTFLLMINDISKGKSQNCSQQVKNLKKFGNSVLHIQLNRWHRNTVLKSRKMQINDNKF